MTLIKKISAFALLLLLGLFIFSNTEPVAIRFLSMNLEAPAAAIVLLSSIAGVALWPLLRAVFAEPG